MITLLTVLSLLPAHAESTNIRLGSVRVAERTDKDVIKLAPCGSSNNQKVNSIQIRVKNKPVQVDKLKVVFHNDQQQELQVKKHLKAGDSSGWLDLKGEARCIKRIVFIGDTDTKKFKPKKQSTVVVFGKVKNVQNSKAKNIVRDDDHPVKKSDDDISKAIRLGAVKLGDVTEKDSIKLLPCASPYNRPVQQLQIKVKNQPAEINKVKLHFYNGTNQMFIVNKHLKVNQESPWIDIKGDRRCIEKITFVGDADTIGYKPGKQSTIVVKGR